MRDVTYRGDGAVYLECNEVTYLTPRLVASDRPIMWMANIMLLQIFAVCQSTQTQHSNSAQTLCQGC